MGVVRDILSTGVSFVKEEILPLRHDLIKAGILKPDEQAFDPKASLIDPLSYQSTGYGYKERYSLLDYGKCRQITYADPIVASVIQTRLNQVASFAMPQIDKYKVGFKINLRDKEKEPTPAETKEALEIQAFIMNCGVPESFEDTPDLKRKDGFETFLRKIVRDSLTFDQINFEITPRNNGMPYRFGAVDAGTIRLISDMKENMERVGAPYIDPVIINPYASQGAFKEYKSQHPRTAQVINGVVRHTFDEWEMAFGVRNPRTDIVAQGYGFSEIEMLVTAITSHMNAETYNRKFFSQGSSIKGVLAFEGSVPPDQLEAFRRQWYQQVTGINNAWRTPIMSLGKDSKMNWVSLHSTNREMEFGKWMEYCIKTICGVFQMDPIEIGFDISRMGAGQGGGGGGLGMANQAERIMFSQDKGLRPLVRHIQNLINEYIVYRLNPDFEFEFVGMNVGDEMGDINKIEKQVKTFKTINEIRSEHDLEDIDMEAIKKNPGNMILDPGFIQFVTGQLQAATEAEAQEQGMGPEGDASMEPDQGGDAEEPDYENMSVEELEQELARLGSEGPNGEQHDQGPENGPGSPNEQDQGPNIPGGKGGSPDAEVAQAATSPQKAPKANKKPIADESAIKSMTAYLELDL